VAGRPAVALGRQRDAELVFDSVMDSATTTRDEGTFWQPEERAWLWYNDTIESHAFALRAMTELRPDDPRRHGLVQWLFLHKQRNQWKSTRATAEVLYALVHYLEREGQLGRRQAAVVTVGDRPAVSATFEPDRFTGSGQVVVAGAEIDPARSAVTVEQSTPGLLFASATWHFSTEELPKAARGDVFEIARRTFRRAGSGEEAVLQPLAEGAVLAPGDEIEVQLAIRSRAPAEYVHLRDPRPAGFEPATAGSVGSARSAGSGYRWDQGLGYYQEIRDSGTNFFFEQLPAGEYVLKYRLRASFAGTFRAGPAVLQSMYAPELAAYSAGEVVRVEP
jgi:alpha-2-macroglobulin